VTIMLKDKFTKARPFILLVAVLVVIGFINYFMLDGNPSQNTVTVEEHMVKDLTGLNVDLDGKP
jgi:hypothetical protein